MSEEELSEYVRADLNQLGYTTYAEVSIKGGGSNRCDFYAIMENKDNEKFGHSIAIEAKLTFNFKVLEQAYFWKTRAHEVYILCPTTYKNIKTRKFAREICKMLGIGVMEVNINSGKYYVTVKPQYCKNPKMPTLYEEQKLTKASNANNDYVTPFKITVKNINDYMLNKDQEYLTKLVKNIKHHYKGDISAVRTIRYMIEKNIIKNFYIIKENNKLIIKKHGF